ncbi:protein lines [Anopheles ziemanni]|nr:protein lines [Anopheles ziemanni]
MPTSSPSISAACCTVGSSGERNSHEQPVIKRQRIEHEDPAGSERTTAVRQVLLQGGSVVDRGGSHTNSSTSTNGGMMVVVATNTTPPSSSGNSSNSSSACSSSTSLSSSPSCSSTKLIPSSLEHSSDDEQQHQQQRHQQHQQLQLHYQHHIPATLDDCHARFQDAIGRQCLCSLDSVVLLGCFKAYYRYEDPNSEVPSVVLPLAEWPFEQLLRFLSNVQLLFDTYLKQNIKGNICAGVMELCNYLIRSDDHQQQQHLHHHHHQHHHNLLLNHHHQHHLLHHHAHSLPARPTRHDGGLATLDIDELIGLCSCSNKYLSYLAGRILSSFLIIVKDDPDDDRWLEKLVANLFDFGHLDLRAVRKISASLEVIKRIVEWKDETEHPLDDDVSGGVGGGGTPGVVDEDIGGPSEWPPGGGSGSSGSVTASTMAGGSGSVYGMPPLADNYFAAHYQYGASDGGNAAASSIFHPAGLSGESSSSSTTTTTTSKAPGSSPSMGSSSSAASSQDHLHHHSASVPPTPPPPPPQSTQADGHHTGHGCRYVTLTDSESFDTTRIKFETINILGGKWSALVKHISSLIRAQANSSSAAVMVATETCILTFLRLWESIISVKANLSVVETQPFHSQLDNFQLLLLVTKNAVIYRQMLTLFNEALCYGSTLALQDLIPEEVGSLAHNIVRSVKDYRILDKMPKSSYSNHLGFLGYQGQMVRYQDRRLQRVVSDSMTPPSAGGSATVAAASETCYDRTLLQKMALLVLKAVAVIVKEIRCDSSDSSVDSSDFDMQEIQMIERSIRDVVKKLETFLKAQLEFHPESHLSKVLIHLFDDQDDYLVEAMVCTLDVTSGISFRNNAFPELIAMLNPVYTFIEFSNLGPNITHLFLDLLISPETCFLLFLLRFLKYIRQNWSMFTQSCYNYYRHNSYSNAATLLQNRVRAAAAAAASTAGAAGSALVLPGDATGATGAANVILDSVMTVLISLRMQISRLVADTLFPYNITPILRLIENCESLYEGNELS